VPLRDILLLSTIVASLPFCLTRPFFGVLMWTWISMMNPHRLSWQTTNLPVGMMVALPTVVGFIISREPKRLPFSFGTVSILLLWVLLSLSTLAPHLPQDAWAAWTERSKILLMLGITIALTTSRERLRLLCLVTAGSVAVFGFKGGIFSIATGGEHMVFGPMGSFIAANNGLALALNMVLPMLVYLAREFQQRWVRGLMAATFLLSALSVVFTYSRGGLLGLGVVMLLLALKTGHRFAAGTLIAVALAGALYLAPEKWFERVQTIQTYQADSSAMSRVNAWILAWRLALARPLLGWGPDAMEDKDLYDIYFPDSDSRADVHSSYFQLLAENGFPAFGVFVSMLLWCLYTLQRLVLSARGDPDRRWIADYANMLQIGICAYMVSAAFLERAFFDLLFQLVGAVIVLNDLARGEARAAVPEAQRFPFVLRPGAPLPHGAGTVARRST
jgi:probable O-glycosylation ligase (exosortase A-associated)